MTRDRNKLYSLLFIACAAGYIWLYFGLNNYNAANGAVEVCLVKHFTNIPCPSCGSTRSVISLTHGDFMAALQINPLGYVVASIMLIAPLWLALDVIKKRNTLFLVYRKMEDYLKRPQYALPLIVLVVANWIWNITKGL